jgi:hypothetical protein
MSVHVGAYKFRCLTPSLFSTCSLHVQRICLQLSRLFARTQRQNTLPNVLDCTRAGWPFHTSRAVAPLVVPRVHRDPRTRARSVPASESDASPPAVEQTQGPKRPPPLSLSILHPLADSAQRCLPLPTTGRWSSSHRRHCTLGTSSHPVYLLSKVAQRDACPAGALGGTALARTALGDMLRT